MRNFFGSDALLEAIEILVPETDPEFKNSLKRDLSFKHVPKPEYCPFSTMFGDDVCLDGTCAVPCEGSDLLNSCVAIDLMRRMVRLLPKDRISVADALRHPFLSNLHNPRDEPVAPRMDFKWGCDATTIEDIKGTRQRPGRPRWCGKRVLEVNGGGQDVMSLHSCSRGIPGDSSV